MKSFPNMGNPTFPGDNVNVYAYENVFDYTRWQPDVRLKICNVGWCSTYENVPGFESDNERDAWFDSVPGREIVLAVETHLLPDGRVKVPVPFDVASTYNYIEVIFPTPTSADAPLAYEQPPRRGRWFFFIVDVRALAGSTTELVLQRDEWTTFYNSCTVSYLMLERGHYPVAKTSVADYLGNPAGKSSLLLAPDVSTSNPRRVATERATVFNDPDGIRACIACNTHVNGGAWGAFEFANVPGGSPDVPALPVYATQGTPSPFVFTIDAANLPTFLNNVDASIPQFKQSVLGIFFINRKYLAESSETFTFCGVACRVASGQQTSCELLPELTPSMFGYPDEYKGFAKLYTSPYAHVELADSRGTLATVRIEDTTGRFDMQASLSLAFPSIKLDGILTGVNGANGSVRFSNITPRTFSYGGRWYDTVMSWDVPTFAVILDSGTAAAVASYYSRKQAASSAETAYNNVLASTAAASSNTAIQVAANETMTNTSNAASTQDTALANALSQGLQAWDAGYSRATQQMDATAETQKAAVGTAGTAVGAATSAVTNALSGNVAGAVASVISGVTSGITTAANTAISINLAADKVEAGIGNTQAHVTATNNNNTSRNANQVDASTSNMETQNAASTAQTANNVGAANANAARSRSNAYNAISNNLAQGGMAAPATYGAAAPGMGAVEPLAVFAHVVTQAPGDIAQAGDAFARYGYALNQQVDASTLNLMKHFTFWKANEVWCVGSDGVPESAQETIKAAFIMGTTVWKNPDEIGKVSIHDNT